MEDNFWGTAVEEHYEKEIKDFNGLDWFLFTIFWGMIIVAVILGFNGMPHAAGICACLDVIMIHVMIRVMSKQKSVVTPHFVVLGILAIAVILANYIFGNDKMAIIVAIAFEFIAFYVGILCVSIAVRKKRKMREYSLMVEAECHTVDERQLNAFHLNQSMHTGIDSASYGGGSMIYKPAFHYFVNGQEYFTESTVYYGNMNSGYTEGQRIWLRVNPNNPRDILPKNADTFVESLVGWMWIGIGVAAGIMYIVLAMNGMLEFH